MSYMRYHCLSNKNKLALDTRPTHHVRKETDLVPSTTTSCNAFEWITMKMKVIQFVRLDVEIYILKVKQSWFSNQINLTYLKNDKEFKLYTRDTLCWLLEMIINTKMHPAIHSSLYNLNIPNAILNMRV